MIPDFEFSELVKRNRQKRQLQQLDLAATIAQLRTQPAILVLTFYAFGYAGIATVQIFDNVARLTRWTDIGPMGHYDIKNLGKLAYELIMEGFNPEPDANAGQVLERWSKMPKWDKGLEFIKKGTIND